MRQLSLLCACSAVETPQQTPTTTTTTTNGTDEMDARRRQPTRPGDADINGPAADGDGDGYEMIPVDTTTYERIAEPAGTGKYYSFVICTL